MFKSFHAARRTAHPVAMRMLVRLAALFCGFAPTVSAQVSGSFFPYHVGDRWVYTLDGTTAGGPLASADTLAGATVEWTVLDVRTSASADTISVRAERRAGGSTVVATCRLLRGRTGSSFLSATLRPYNSLCTSRSGFPFGTIGTTSYPFLYGPTPIGLGTVDVGGITYAVETARGQFFNSYQSPPRPPFAVTSTKVESVLAAGIGIVETTVIESHNENSVPFNRDTLRVRLVGAVVGGQTYGRIDPVASEAGPSSSALSVHVGPNPARGTATVRVGGASGETTLRVVDVRGRVVREMEVAAGASSTVLDLGGLAPGVYGVRVEGGGSVAVARLVVVR